MSEFLLKIPASKKGKVLLNFLREIDFIEISELDRLALMKDEITQSLNDIKKGRVRSWNGKKVRLKNA